MMTAFFFQVSAYGSFRKTVVKRGQKLTVKKFRGRGITSLVPTPHTVFTSSKGAG